VENIFTEIAVLEGAPEQPEFEEYVVPFFEGDEQLIHNLRVLEAISMENSDENVLQDIKVGKEAYNIRSTQVYSLGEDGRKIFLTGNPGSSNRVAFYAYPSSVQPPLDGLEASPYLRVYKIELTMQRKTNREALETTWGEDIQFYHRYPEINTEILFVDWGAGIKYGDIPSRYILNRIGDPSIPRLEDDYLRYVEFGDYPVVGIGRRSPKQFYGEERSYRRFLKSIERFTRSQGGLLPKEVYLQLAFTEKEEYESNLVISI
jgi:hypothetical protein